MPRTYKNAPIIEAIIDIRTSTCVDFLSYSQKIEKSFSADFPNKEEIRENIIEFNISPKSRRQSSTDKMVGYKYTDEKKEFALQIKDTGFTFSKLEGYDQWKTFSQKAKDFWKKYIKIIKPEKIERVAVRYVNRLDVPDNNFDLGQYFYTCPKVFNKNKTEIVDFFMQLKIPQKEGGFALINQTSQNSSYNDKKTILFDIDVFDASLNDYAKKDDKLWKRINTLRKQKNQIFEDSITEKIRELIK